MKPSLDPHLLQKARDAALHKVKNSMPGHGETPDMHVARCWAESLIDVGLLELTKEQQVKSSIKALTYVIEGYERRIQCVKDEAEGMAIEASNQTARIEMPCHPEARSPGMYFGFMLGIKAALDILEDWT